MNFVLERLHDNTRFVFGEHNRSYTCGRGKENDIICLSLFVSRRHCIFFRENENLYVTDLRSSNGIFINGEARKSLQMIKLYENDVIGIGCPNSSNNSNNSDESVYIYKVCIIKLPILDEEEETSTLSRTIVNNNTLERISVSPVGRVLGEKYAPNSDCNRIVSEKMSKVVRNNEHDSGVNSSKESNFNLSRDNKSPHNSTNNLVETKHDIIDISAEDDIEIVHASLAEEVKEDTMGCNLESAKCLNSNNKSDFEKMNISGIENNNDNANDKDISKNHVRKISESTDEQDVEQAIKYEDELQITDDDEEAHIAAIECDTTRDKSPIKLKKTRHEPKMRFSLIDVVDLSDDEEGVFPYSQLFDIKYEDNTENRTEIKQECVNDDDLNIEKIGLLNVDDEVIILTDCEDEDNKTGPWLERLSRSQLLNEDIKPVSYDMVIKDEIDLGLWEDEILNIIEQNIETRVLPCTSQFSCNKEISPEPCTSIDVKTKSKTDDCNINLPTTKVNAIDVNEVGLSNKSSSKDIDDKGKQKTNAKQNINLSTAEVYTMDVDEVGPSNKPSSKDIDNKGKQKTKAKRNINLPMVEVNAMDVNEVGPSNKPSSKDIDDKDKQKTKLKQNIYLPMAEVNAMDVNEVGPSNKPSSKDIDDKDKQKTKSKQNIYLPMAEVNAMDVDEVGPSNKPSSKDIDDKGKQKTNAKQNINLPTAEVDTMDVDEVGPFNKPSSKDIDNKDKQKTKEKQNINLPMAEVNAMDVNEVGPSNKPSSKDIDDKHKQKTKLKQNIYLPMAEVNAMDVNEVGPSNKPSSKDIDDKDKQKTKSKQNIYLPMAEVNAMDVNEVGPSNKPSSKDIDNKDKQKTKSKQNIDLPMAEVNAMDVDEVGLSNKPSLKDIDDKGKQKTNAKQNINLPTAEVDTMDVDEVGPSNKPSSRDIDNKGKQKINAKQNINLPTAEMDAMTIDETGPSKKFSSENIDDKAKQKTDVKQNTELNKQTIESVKQKLLAKSTTRRLIPVIEPLNLPPKRRRIDHSKDRATKVPETSQSKLITEEKMSKLKKKLNDNFYDKKQKRRKKESKSVIDNCSSSETKSGPPISKDEKQKIIEKRKMKLKEIAAEEKKLSAGNDQDIKRRIAKPRAKISLKNRGDFLIAEQEPRVSKLLPNKSVELPKLSDDQFKKRSTDKADVVKKSATSDKRTRKTNVFKDTINNTASLQQSLHLDNMSTAQTIKESTLDVKATDDNVKKRSSSKRSIKRSNVNSDPTAKASKLRDRSIERDSTVQKANFSPNSLKSKLMKSSMKSRTKSSTKSKKKVSFSDEIEMREYEIDQSNTLKKLTWKDAPIPTSKLTRAPVIYADWNPKLEEFLLRIFMWNPVWLEEQRYLKCTAPIVSESELQAMRLSYDSYKHYYEVAMPLLLLEIWCIMSKDFEMIQKNMQRATMMCSTVENSITFTPIPSTNLFLTTLTVEVLVNKEDLNKRTHPIYGDLVYLEYVKNVCGKQIFHKIFAYVTNMQHMIITDFTHYNRDLRNYVKNPYSVITYTLLTRPLEHDIPINRVQRVRTVTYLRSNIRMVQALQYLPQSPLLKLIVNPKIEDYQLPSLNEQYTSPSLVTKDNLNPKQLEAVFRVTDAVVKKTAKLCFIQGPPGTGKSKVIVNLVSQILYGERQDKKSLRILICAPSNAAIDEIVLRLLNIRSVLKQKRFNMVRIGRSESMHPQAKNISLPELARRYLMKITKSQKAALNGNSANEDIAILQARINSLETELESIQKIDEAKKKILMNKLVETSAKCELIKSGKSIDELNPKDRAKYQRISENIILTGANIIACTLSSCYNNQMESIFGGHKERISVCIVDEATQSCEAETLIPLMLGVNTLVLVGDPNQLPATILSQRAKKLGLDQSVFSRMQNVFASQPNSPIIMLETQYRMEYAISYWPNKYFYGGKLRNAAECRIKFPFHSYRVLYHDFTQNDDKFSNTTEAEFVANIIYAMLMFAKWETTSATISLGVLTPYNNQRTLVLNKINEKISSVPDNIKKKINFEVNTVDGFQGQERDVIIMSCVRSNGIGFLSDKQRLCVALTRAKHSLILCGNFCTFMKDQMWKALLTDARGRGVLCHVNANATPAIIKQFIVK